MKTENRPTTSYLGPVGLSLLLVAVVTGLLAAGTAEAASVALTVKGSDGTTITGYRWIVEEDLTKVARPGIADPPGAALALSLHTSYAARPIATGCQTCLANGSQPAPAASSLASVNLDPAKHYFVTVLPNEGYSISGAPIEVNRLNPAGAFPSTVTVVCNKLPLPTAQISVLVFWDHFPINNAPDEPEEVGLQGFTVLTYEAGGTYGQSGGQVSTNIYGDPIGTEYLSDAAGHVITNPDGTPQQITRMGQGYLKTDANGQAYVKHLGQGKYTIFVVPPAGQGWVQTATIEGTKGNDAWVKPNEPPVFVEFGPPGPHVFMGFVQRMNEFASLGGGTTIKGQITNLHNSRPPDYTFYGGEPVEGAWVGLNNLTTGVGRGVYAAPCDPTTGHFEIAHVPPGNYELAVWDENLDMIFANLAVNVPNPAPATIDLTDVPVFSWFAKYDAEVFFDRNGNGFRDCVTAACDDKILDEVGIPDQALNIRFRDGSIYQSGATDRDGKYSFKEVFPFFNWMIAEVDFTRFKPTGATIVTDAGGVVLPDNGWTYPSWGKLNPQPQFCTAADAADTGCTVGAPLVNSNTTNNLARTELGMVLLEGFQDFLGQTNVIQWGKQPYDDAAGENGGIAGIVQYGITRAEDDPRYAAAENWEPGIPQVQVNLYRDCDRDGKIDAPTGTVPSPFGCSALSSEGHVQVLADVDNYPFGWSDGSAAKGSEDVDRNGNGTFDWGDAVDVTTTDAWDDKPPTGCQGDVFYAHNDPSQPTDCFDGLRNFNQVRPAVFDGGYAFGRVAGKEDLPVGNYIIEANAPPGYIHQKEEDKNVDFGDSYTPSTQLLPAPCVGDEHLVPEYLSMFPNQQVGGNYAGQMRPLCDRKEVFLAAGTQPAPNFFLWTEVPVAGHIVGIILDDTANEFNPYAPNFGEKYAPPFLPISIRDWTGRELSRVYADEYGAYNAVVPSTYSINPPLPSGVGPNMITVCLNDPGPVPDPANPARLITDPYYNRQYSQFCYTFQYLPGKTTYLDTPVIPVAAFAGAQQFPLDCELTNKTPRLYRVDGPGMSGPWIPTTPAAQRTITLTSVGMLSVPNPTYNTDPTMGAIDTNKTVVRDYSFGPDTIVAGVRQGKVIGLNNAGQDVPLTITSWTPDVITATVPASVVTGQLHVIRGDNLSKTITGITLTSGGTAPIRVGPSQTYKTIQAAIDAAAKNSLILVEPGVYYELVIMWKPVRLQGYGEGSTSITAVKTPAEKIMAWRAKMLTLVSTGQVDLLPGQTAGGGLPEPTMLNTDEGAGVFVIGKASGPNQFTNSPNARIDGFTITGGDHGGGINVNGYGRYLEISNNRVSGNAGFYAGGIRIGQPNLAFDPPGGAALDYVNANNNNTNIHNNQITENGGQEGAGGGLLLCTGATNYKVLGNWVCGNFSLGDGGGIAHYGLSNNGLISGNTVIFNQSFNQGTPANGGGILISGAPALAVNGLSPGSGSVVIDKNLIQGNQSGAGDGGGIRAQFVNGQDVVGPLRQNFPALWYSLGIYNNMIVDNMAGLAGGGISLQDTAQVSILHNTIANNDSTGTAGLAFTPGNPNQSNPQPAGIVSRAHSLQLTNAIGSLATVKPYKYFSNPVFLMNNIIYHNRSFYFFVDDTLNPPFQLRAATPAYQDLAVLGTATPCPTTLLSPCAMSPQYDLLTSTAGYAATNVDGTLNPPQFIREYLNGGRNSIIYPENTTAITPGPAFDEGGNFIDVHFGPLSLTIPAGQANAGLPFGNYHIQSTSPVIRKGTGTFLLPLLQYLNRDFDLETRPRPVLTAPDLGADEVAQ